MDKLDSLFRSLKKLEKQLCYAKKLRDTAAAHHVQIEQESRFYLFARPKMYK